LLGAAVAAVTGCPRVDDAQRVAGGCINECFAVTQEGARFFVKLNAASFADAFAAEADGLAALGAQGVRVPHPLAHACIEDTAFLVLEHLSLAESGDFRALGSALARLHAASQPGFGWRRDNYIGATPQRNRAHASWRDFWISERLAPQLEMAAHKGYRLDAQRLLEAVSELLAGHEPQAALLHGDLWRGNAGFLRDGTPVMFDPAVYCGDAEADLAMTELFGGFPPEFYAGYRTTHATSPGYERRRPLYNLYHVLNHLNLFGGDYLAQAQVMIARVTSPNEGSR
jgi:protein-ribulosamine 3-kinase